MWQVMRHLNQLCRDDAAAKEALQLAIELGVQDCLMLEFDGDESQVNEVLGHLEVLADSVLGE